MTTIEQIEDYLLITIEASFEPKVQKFIDAVTAYIERYTGRKFTADTTASTRIYDGTGDGELVIDDAVEVTKVEIDDEVVDTTDYYLYPTNKLPKTRIIMPYRVFRWANQNVKVTAKWGYGGSIPADLAFAATVLVAGIINSSHSHEGEILSEAIGRYQVTYRTPQQQNDGELAKEIIKKYKRYI